MKKISELYVCISMGLYKITLHLYGIWVLRFDLLRQYQCVSKAGRGKKMQPLDIAMKVGAKEHSS